MRDAASEWVSWDVGACVHWLSWCVSILVQQRARQKRIKLTHANVLAQVSHKIDQGKINSLPLQKDVHVYHILLRHLSANGGRSIVFVNAIGEARRLAAILNLLRVRAVLLHSSLQQRQRLKNLDVFKGDRSCVMIATDLAARGLDMPNIELIIHFHVPKV